MQSRASSSCLSAIRAGESSSIYSRIILFCARRKRSDALSNSVSICVITLFLIYWYTSLPKLSTQCCWKPGMAF